jgi:hypothetical protein
MEVVDFNEEFQSVVYKDGAINRVMAYRIFQEWYGKRRNDPMATD